MTDMTNLGAHSPAEEAERLDAVERVYAGKSETPLTDRVRETLRRGIGNRQATVGESWMLGQYEALEKETVRLRAGILDAIATIKTWHSIGEMGQDSGITWQIYYKNSPEMKRLTSLLSPAPTERADK